MQENEQPIETNVKKNDHDHGMVFRSRHWLRWVLSIAVAAVLGLSVIEMFHQFKIRIPGIMKNTKKGIRRPATQPPPTPPLPPPYFTKDWNPHVINNVSCPKFVLAELGSQGLGDQLEHYLYYLYLAKLLDATLVVDGFSNTTGVPHSGISEYSWVAEHLFGINMKWNVTNVRREYQPGTIYLKYDDVSAAKSKEIVGGPTASSLLLPCNYMATSSIHSCDGWCHLNRPFFALTEVGWILRQNQGYKKCHLHYSKKKRTISSNITTTESTNDVVVAWHMRTGDICLHCDDISYYRQIHLLLNKSLEGYRYKIIFELQSKVISLEREFPHAQFNIGSKLEQSVCNFLTADILVTGGSSFPVMVAAFGGAPWQPIVFEERIKFVPEKPAVQMTKHYYQNDDAILLDEGRPLRHPYEVTQLVQGVLGRSRKQFIRFSAVHNQEHPE